MKIIIALILLFPFRLFSQNSFELLIDKPEAQRAWSMIETGNSYILSVQSLNYNTPGYGTYLTKISKTGKLVDEIQIEPKKNNFLSTMIKIEPDKFITLGCIESDTSDKYDFFVTQYDSSLNELWQKKYYTGKYQIGVGQSIINSEGNIIYSGSVRSTYSGLTTSYIFFCELNANGDTLKTKYISGAPFAGSADIIEKNDSPGYYSLDIGASYSMQMYQFAEYDKQFNFVNNHPIQHGFGNAACIAYDTDTTYLIVGRNSPFSSAETYNLGVLQCDTLHNELKYELYGNADTAHYSGLSDCFSFNRLTLDFYLSGTSNFDIYSYPFQKVPSWILVNNISKNIELNWQKYFGGDANYVNYICHATDDGGVLLINTRYDYNDNFDYDLHILKLNSQGNLPVSVPEISDAKMSELIIYPNPGTAQITVRTASQALGGEFVLCDISGKTVFQTSIKERFTSVSTNALPEGVYVYKYVLNGTVKETGKWVKAKK